MGLTPATLEEARDAVAELRERGRHAVVVGGGTLLHVADRADEPAEQLRTTALDRVSFYEPAELIVTCGAGVTLAQLQETLAAGGQFVPVWHPRPAAATVGGLVAFGWTGLGRHLYGRLRDRVLEMRVVTGEGKIVRAGARVVKSVTGFDLPRLFFGSIGTLGVICELSLKVQPRPGPVFGATMNGPEPAALVAALQTKRLEAPQPIEAVVRLDADGWRAWAFAPGPEADARVLLGGLERIGVREAEFAALAGDPLLTGEAGGTVVRVTVRPSDVAELAGRIAWRRALADVASGVVWAEPADADDVAPLRDWAVSRGGSLVLLAAPDELRSRLGTWGPVPGGLELMRRLREQFDPDRVLGRGRFVVA